MINVFILFEEPADRYLADIYIRRFWKQYATMEVGKRTALKLGPWDFVDSCKISGLHMFNYTIPWADESAVAALCGEQNYHEAATIFVGDSFSIETPDCYEIVDESLTPIMTSFDDTDNCVMTRYVPR